MVNKTNRSKSEHPVFDRKEFRVEASAKALKTWETYFSGQPAKLAEALHALAKSRPSRQFVGEEIRKYLERNREKYFPGCRLKDVTRIFSGYCGRLIRAGLIQQTSREA